MNLHLWGWHGRSICIRWYGSEVVLDMFEADGIGMVGAFASDGMAAEVILDMFEADGIGMVGAFASDGMAAELLLVAMAS